MRRTTCGAIKASVRPWNPRFGSAGEAAKRALDLSGALLASVLLLPLFVLCALVVKLSSRGPILYRCSRIGRHGIRFEMLKFRKMRHGVSGPPLTGGADDRFTRVGRLLARSKLDELPQLVNVLRGEMSLVGPRPEDAVFVARALQEFERILQVRPGITGLSQLAFARESEILDTAGDREERYLTRLLPQKIGLDQLYAEERSLGMDLRIVLWTAAAVVLRREVAVHRESGHLRLRKRPTAHAMGTLGAG